MCCLKRTHQLLLLAVVLVLAKAHHEHDHHEHDHHEHDHNEHDHYEHDHYENTVEYYENVIDATIQSTYSFVEPTNANQYIGNYYEDVAPDDYGYFDFVIVGSGSAGAPLAARLANGTNKTVLLLEVGLPEDTFTDIPGLYFYDRFTPYNWGFVSVPQKGACQGCVDKICPFARGKALGGTTVINGLVYSRGNREDFNRWNSLNSIGNWSYAAMLPYFIELESSNLPNGDRAYEGFHGPIPVSYHIPVSPQLTAFLQANVETGRKIVDYNGPSQFGVSCTQLNTEHGRRVSTARAFLRSPPSNLKIMLEAYVTKLLFANDSYVEAVEFTLRGNKSIVRGGEIILSGGVFGSPHILLVSGIGPAEELRRHNIMVRQDLPVGRNLQDHATFYGLIYDSNYTQPIQSRREYVEEFLNGTGPYTIPANFQGIGYYETENALVPGVPNIEVLFLPSNSTFDTNQRAFRLTNATYDTIWKYVNRTRTFVTYIVLLKPRSVGFVALESNNPFAYPLINPRFLTDKYNQDIESIYQGVQLILDLLKTDALRGINASLLNYTFNECKDYEYNSREYWYCTIRIITLDVYHPIGTCRMANRNLGGVVDGDARVYGVTNLRVADASVLPFAFSGHPSTPTIALGAKLADMIKREYNI